MKTNETKEGRCQPAKHEDRNKTLIEMFEVITNKQQHQQVQGILNIYIIQDIYHKSVIVLLPWSRIYKTS